MTIIQGNPGEGKTYFAMRLAAACTNRKPLPGMETLEPFNIIYQKMCIRDRAYIKTESDVLKFVTALIANTKGDGKEGDEFWTKAETLLYCALVSYIVFEGPEEERNMNTLVEMIYSMEVQMCIRDRPNAVAKGVQPVSCNGHIGRAHSRCARS